MKKNNKKIKLCKHQKKGVDEFLKDFLNEKTPIIKKAMRLSIKDEQNIQQIAKLLRKAEKQENIYCKRWHLKFTHTPMGFFVEGLNKRDMHSFAANHPESLYEAFKLAKRYIDNHEINFSSVKKDNKPFKPQTLVSVGKIGNLHVKTLTGVTSKEFVDRLSEKLAIPPVFTEPIDVEAPTPPNPQLLQKNSKKSGFTEKEKYFWFLVGGLFYAIFHLIIKVIVQ